MNPIDRTPAGWLLHPTTATPPQGAAHHSMPPSDLGTGQTPDPVAPTTDRQVTRTAMMTTSDPVGTAPSASRTGDDSDAVIAGGMTADAGHAVADVEPADTINADTINTDSINTETARTLWEALIRARSQSPVISAAEDAVFRFYLPLARATARTYVGWAVDPDLAEQAAELGLANAVLAWRRADICAFAAFARAAMIRQMSTANARGRRLRQSVPARAAAATRDSTAGG